MPLSEDAWSVTRVLRAEAMQVEVATSTLAADLASLLRRCGYQEVEIDGRFLRVARIHPDLRRLEDIRLAALVDVWRRRHGGAMAARRQ
jgi:hypothetical protein